MNCPLPKRVDVVSEVEKWLKQLTRNVFGTYGIETPNEHKEVKKHIVDHSEPTFARGNSGTRATDSFLNAVAMPVGEDDDVLDMR